MTTATARSTTLPRRMKSLNPLSMAISLGGVSRGGSPLPGRRATLPQPVSQCPAAYSLSRDAPARAGPRPVRRGRRRPRRAGSAGRSAAPRVTTSTRRPGTSSAATAASPSRTGTAAADAARRGPGSDEADVGDRLTGPCRADEHPAVGRRRIAHRAGRDELGRPQPEREVGGAHGATRGEVDGGDDDRPRGPIPAVARPPMTNAARGGLRTRCGARSSIRRHRGPPRSAPSRWRRRGLRRASDTERR